MFSEGDRVEADENIHIFWMRQVKMFSEHPPLNVILRGPVNFD